MKIPKWDKIQQYINSLVDELYNSNIRQWKTASGTIINITDMTNNHLSNTIKQLEARNPNHPQLSILKEELKFRIRMRITKR